MLNVNREAAPPRNGPAQNPGLGDTPVGADEAPMLELLAEGATSIRQVEADEAFPVEVLSLGESRPLDDLADHLNFSLDDFPLPPIGETDFPEPLPYGAMEAEDEAEGQPAGAAPQPKTKKGLLAKLRGMLGYRLTVTRGGGFSWGRRVPNSELEEEPVPIAKKPKPVRQKAPKKPKAKKPKPVRAAKMKVPKDKKEPQNNRKLVIGGIAAAVIMVGSVGAFLLTRSWNQPEKLMEKARQYMEEEQYGKAVSTYEKVIKTNEMVPEAYLEMAESLVASDDLEGALGKLSLGYRETEDERLSRRLAQLDPQPDPVEGEEAAPALSAEPIQWKDPAFEAMVRLALKKPQGSITQADLAGVTNLKILGSGHASVKGDLNAINGVDGYTIGGETYTQRGTITSLDDVVNFTNLSRLTVGYNQVRDISALEDMNLSTISLYANDLSDISPLRQVKTLRFLYLYNNNISDISPLAGQTELLSLSLQHNQIRDITPLAGLSRLEELYISNNLVEDLSPLKQLKNLTFLDACNNQITNLDPVSGLKGLTDASFTGNPVTNYAPVSHITNLNRPFGKTG